MARKNDMEVSEMHQSSTATVHGMVVGELSPIKTSRKRSSVKYFEGNISDGRKVARMISFEPSLRSEIQQIKDCGDSVKYAIAVFNQTKCQVQGSMIWKLY